MYNKTDTLYIDNSDVYYLAAIEWVLFFFSFIKIYAYLTYE